MQEELFGTIEAVRPNRRNLIIGAVLVLAVVLVAVQARTGVDEPPTEVANVEPNDDVADAEPDDSIGVFDNQGAAILEARDEIFGGDRYSILETGSALPMFSRTFAALVADFNGDGLDDIQLSRHHSARFAPTDADGIWLNDGAGNYLLSQQLEGFVDRHGCTAGDVNGDSAIDFFCTRGASKGSTAINLDGQLKTKANELYLNRGDGTFEEVGEEWGVADPWGRGRDALLFDFDNDDRLDLYVMNTYDRIDAKRSVNILYRNKGDSFVEQPGALTGEQGFSCPLVMDWNQDGWHDIVLCKSGHPVFFQNDGGEFTDVTDVVLADRRGWQHVVAGDLDGDGDDDLAVVRKSAVEIWTWNESRGTFKLAVKHDIFGFGHWVAVGDFAGDGALDVFVLAARQDCVDVDVSSSNEHDLLLMGPTFEPFVRATHGLGCGDRAYAVDGTHILILNGASKTRGPVEIADLRTSVAPLAPIPQPADAGDGQ